MLEFCRHIDRPRINQFDRDVYNARIRTFYNNFAEFVALHYALSIRDDTKYWRKNRNKVFDSDIRNSTGGFNDLYLRKTQNLKHYGNGGIVCIANGMNYNVYTGIDVSKQELGINIDLKQRCDDFLQDRQLKIDQWHQAVKNQLSAYVWLKTNIYNEDIEINE